MYFMQTKFFITLLLAVFTTISLQAQQTTKGKEIKSTVGGSTKAANLEKMQLDGKANANKAKQDLRDMAANKTGGMAAYMAMTDIKLTADEKKHTINAYKVDFPSNPYGTNDNIVASISLYTGASKEPQKIGVINFYAGNAKALADRVTVDNKEFVTLSYHADSFNNVQNLLANSLKLVLVLNNKTKEAYISTDVVATRAR